MDKTLKIALLLSAKTAAASNAVGRFTKDSEAKFKRLEKASQSWNSAGNRNLKRGAFMAAPLALAVNEAMKLEDAIADVAKVANVDFGTEAFAALEQGAINVSNKLGVAAGDVGELMAELAAGGVSSDRLEAIAEMAGKVGVAFDVTASEAGSAFMTIQNSMALTEQETKYTLDAMNAATNRFGGKASELLNFMAQGGASVAQTLGVAGAEMQAFGNAMQVVGVTSSEAATTMQRFQQAILMKAPLKKMFEEAGGGAQGLIAILEKANASGNATQWLLKQGVGQYATKLGQLAMNLDTDKGLRAQLDFLREAGNVEGSSDAEFENRMKTTRSQLNLLKAQAVNAGISIGQKLLPVVMKIAQQLKPVIENITRWIGENPKLVDQIAKVAAAVAVGTLALGAVQKAVGGAIMIFARLQKVFMLLAANPWILAIAAIAGAAYLIYKNWGKITAFFRSIWDAVAHTFKRVLKFIGVLVLRFTPYGLIYKNWGAISAWFSSVWEKVTSVFSTAWEGIKQLFLNYHPVGLVITHWDTIVEYFSGLWDRVKAIFSDFIDWIRNSWLGKAVGAISGVFSSIKDLWDRTDNTSFNVLMNEANRPPQGAFAPAVVSPPPRPQPVPMRTMNNQVITTFNIPLYGKATKEDADMIKNEIKKELPRWLAAQQHQQNRVALG